MLVAQLLEDGRDSLAGTAPGGEVVDDDGAVGALNLGLEVGSAVGVSLVNAETEERESGV